MTYISGGTTKGLLRLTAPTTTPALSVAGEGRIYFDGTQFLASQNGAAYTAVVGGGGGGGWTDDGTVVRLTTVGDGVGIGTAAPAASSKLEVLGDTTRKDVLVTGGQALVGGAVIVLSGAGAGDGASSGVLTLGSGDAAYGSTTGGVTGNVTIRSGSLTGTPNDQGDFAGHIDILVGNGVAVAGDNGQGGTVTISAGSTSGDNASSGGLSFNAGSAAGTNSTGGSVTLAAGGGYSAGNLTISAQVPGPGGGGEITMTSGANLSIAGGPDGIVGIAASGPSAAIQLAYADATPWSAVTLDTNGVTVDFPGGGQFTVNGDSNFSGPSFTATTDGGVLGGDSTRLYITPNLGIILEIGNTIKIDPDGTNNWIYGDDAAVAATPGEPLTLRGGQGNTTGAGGQLRLRGGAGGATGAGANTVIVGGAGGATSGAAGGVSVSGGTPVDGNGGSVTITGSNGVGTNRDGGNITLTPGSATGSGTPGATFVTGVLNLDAAIYTGGVTYSGGSSYLLANRLVDPQSGDLTLTDQTSRTVYTNEGAAANITLTLPAAVAGLSYTFFVRETGGDSLIIQAGAGDTIQIAANVSTAGGTAESNVAGDAVTLVAINSTEWVSISVVGTGWSVA